MTVTQLLLTKHYRGNVSELSRDLKINRGTLRKYLEDEKGEQHLITEVDGKYTLYAKIGGE